MRTYQALAFSILLTGLALTLVPDSHAEHAATPARQLRPCCHDTDLFHLDPLPEPVATLAAAIETKIAKWSPAVVPHLMPEEVAATIAWAVIEEDCGGEPKFTLPLDGRKRCVWAEGWNSDLRKAMLLAALAYYEGARFARYVDEGRCHDWMHLVYNHEPLPDDAYVEIGGKRLDLLKFGNCDGGRAWSLWQIRPDSLERPKLEGPELRDRSYAASIALGIVRLSMRDRGDLCDYTGENPAGGCPKARERLDFAAKAFKR